MGMVLIKKRLEKDVAVTVSIYVFYGKWGNEEEKLDRLTVFSGVLYLTRRI
ncbi:hypothetical protein ES703_25081 [subsurface metagenome]